MFWCLFEHLALVIAWPVLLTSLSSIVVRLSSAENGQMRSLINWRTAWCGGLIPSGCHLGLQCAPGLVKGNRHPFMLHEEPAIWSHSDQLKLRLPCWLWSSSGISQVQVNGMLEWNRWSRMSGGDRSVKCCWLTGNSMPELLNPHLHTNSSQNTKERRLQSFETFHMLDVCLHSCLTAITTVTVC